MKKLLALLLCTVLLVPSVCGNLVFAEAAEPVSLEALSAYIDQHVTATENPDGTITYTMMPNTEAPALPLAAPVQLSSTVTAAGSVHNAVARGDYGYTTGQTHTWLPLEQRYIYSLLNEEWKGYYRQLDTAVRNLEAKVTFATDVSVDSKERLYFLYMYDTPELFFLSKTVTTSISGNGESGFLFSYSVGRGENEFCGYGYALREPNEALRQKIRNKKALFDAKVAEIISTIPANAPDVVKERLLYDYILKNSSYNMPAATNNPNAIGGLWDYRAADNWTAYGILVNNTGVCESYSEAFQTLCIAVGIPCATVEGSAGGGHQWNTVKIGGEWYMCDITFDDPVGNSPDDAYHSYFNRTSAEFKELNHQWLQNRCEGYFSFVVVPECTATTYSWHNFVSLFGDADDGTAHSFSGGCDATCNNCSFVRSHTDPHVYDNGTDTECNVCHERRVLKNGWVPEGGKWYFYNNGQLVKNSWKADSKGWCYVGPNGYMLTNAWVRDSVGWCYVGSDGYCVTNCWKQDSKGWCYLDAQGRMATNKWIRDSQGWCYVGADGYCVTNCWKRDSVGWVYLNSAGRMATNCWVRDSVGWCYVGADGYAVTNCWKRDSVGWCYLNSNGSMTKSQWLKDGGKWYYLDGNGYMVTGRRVIGGKTYVFDANGVLK
ncbi:MAG: hypothetical protein IKB04_08330 [Clostridia bacterium]|nr:hypothetical protein [Clostridia bacterium]